jgi:hypothetical protein
MSELDVIVTHIRAGQAVEYERLFAERELPRWREYKARGAFISVRISRAAFGTGRREDVVKYVIAVEVPSHAEHREHDADPGFQEFNRLADALQPEDPLVYGGGTSHSLIATRGCTLPWALDGGHVARIPGQMCHLRGFRPRTDCSYRRTLCRASALTTPKSASG